MTAPKAATTTNGVPAWTLTVLQAAVFAFATIVCFRATSHEQQWILAAAGAVAIGWALARPGSPGATIWILIIGSWWLTGLSTPSPGTTLQAALLVLAGHYLTAVRASTHRTTRLSIGYLATSLGVLTALLLATALVAPLITLISNSPITSDQWTVVWTTAALAVFAGLAAWLTRETGC